MLKTVTNNQLKNLHRHAINSSGRSYNRLLGTKGSVDALCNQLPIESFTNVAGLQRFYKKLF